MITLEQARSLKRGDRLHSTWVRDCIRDHRGPEVWRVNGEVQTFKRDPKRVEVPLKRGLYEYDRLVSRTGFNEAGFRNTHLESECPATTQAHV